MEVTPRLAIQLLRSREYQDDPMMQLACLVIEDQQETITGLEVQLSKLKREAKEKEVELSGMRVTNAIKKA